MFKKITLLGVMGLPCPNTSYIQGIKQIHQAITIVPKLNYKAKCYTGGILLWCLLFSASIALAQPNFDKAKTISDKTVANSLPTGKGKGGAPFYVGERLPDIYFNQILNSADKSAKLSDFKAKVIILDFWATWCSNCIKGFASLDTLQKKYGRYLRVLLVNNSSRDDLAKVATFLDKYKIDYPNFSLPLVMGNSATKKLHSAGSLPHYLWIGYDRKVKAITGSEEIKAENIERLIAGLPLALPVKEDGHE